MSHLYPAFLVPLLALALRAGAELADRARVAGDEPAQRDAVTRADTLVGHARVLMSADAWSLGSAPPETLLHVELCELEAGRARGESRADAWAAHAARHQPTRRRRVSERDRSWTRSRSSRARPASASSKTSASICRPRSRR